MNVPTFFTKINKRTVARDVFALFLMTSIAGYFVGVMGWQPEIRVLAVLNIVVLIVGFCIAGCLTPVHRWRHLLLVATFLWLTGIINLLIFSSAAMWLAVWLKSFPVVAICALIGGGLSFAFRK